MKAFGFLYIYSCIFERIIGVRPLESNFFIQKLSKAAIIKTTFATTVFVLLSSIFHSSSFLFFSFSLILGSINNQRFKTKRRQFYLTFATVSSGLLIGSTRKACKFRLVRFQTSGYRYTDFSFYTTPNSAILYHSNSSRRQKFCILCILLPQILGCVSKLKL